MKRNVVILVSFICPLLALPLNGQEKVRIENERMLELCMDTTVCIVTALNPVMGYGKATE